jgi:EAL domain-containing protein (putative c-di-GMP-specific phosphodiesterase class I)
MHALRHSVEWAPRIRSALKDGRFMLEFQPIYSLKTGDITHYECLIRMIGEKSGEVYQPQQFIPVAEDMGLIYQIDCWAMNRAFEMLDKLPEHISLAINLSSHALLNESFYGLVQDKLQEIDVNPDRIIFEITETTAISNYKQAKRMVTQIQSLGCNFALDDFGAGFNSYNYLKHFPVDILKIDGSFITQLEHDPVDQLLVKSMIDIAHRLGKKTVAEYVERESTLELLKNYGVDYIQGFLIGRPQSQID